MDICIMRLFRVMIMLCLSIVIVSCEKKDKPIVLPPKGDGALLELNMGENYEFQYYVSLRDNKIVHISRTDMWDLAFQTGASEHGIYLNGGKGMAAFATNKKNYHDVGLLDTLGATKRWKIDRPCGSIDSLAIGEWLPHSWVYLIRLDKEGKKIRKLKVLYEDAFQYRIKVGDVNAADGFEYTIYKRPEYNFTYFSFDFLKEIEKVEPPKVQWDIVSTLYSFTFYDQNPPLPYVVNGFLLNPLNTEAYKDSLIGYDNVNKEVASSLEFSTSWDVIGFDWKSYDLNTNIYSVNKRYSYIVRTQNGAMFKMRFIDFYSAGGVKGSPKFEFKPL